MQKWEYLELLFTSSMVPNGVIKYASINDIMITNIDNRDEFDLYNYLSKLGKEGWEMIQVYKWKLNSEHEIYESTTYYFKRPIE